MALVHRFCWYQSPAVRFYQLVSDDCNTPQFLDQ